MGFEPMASFLPRMCATPAPHEQLHTTTEMGVGMVGSGGFEPPKLSQLIYSQSHLSTLVTAQIVKHASSF